MEMKEGMREVVRRREMRGVKGKGDVKHGDEGGKKEGMREVVRKREMRGVKGKGV